MVIKQLALWSLMLLIEIIIMALVISPDYVKRQMYAERVSVLEWMGPGPLNAVDENAKKLYDVAVVRSGMMKWVYELYVPESQRHLIEEERTGTAREMVTDRLNGFFLSIYTVIMRVAILWAWFPFVFILGAACVIDGAMRREVKKYTYGYSSPVRYNFAYQTMVSLLMALPFYLALPVTVPAYVPLIWGVFSAIILNLLFSNIQKQI